MSVAPAKNVEHPAPHRDRFSLWWLLFGVAAAPVLWALQLLLGDAITSVACFPGDLPRVEPPGAWLRWLLLALDISAIGISVAAAFVSYRGWRASGDETAAAVASRAVAGGRTRFIALWGMMTSAGFLAAIVFATIASMMVPLCG